MEKFAHFLASFKMQFQLNISFRLLLMWHQMLIFSTRESTSATPNMRNSFRTLGELFTRTKSSMFFVSHLTKWNKSVAFDLVEWSNMLHVAMNYATREGLPKGKVCSGQKKLMGNSPKNLMACSTHTHVRIISCIKLFITRRGNNKRTSSKIPNVILFNRRAERMCWWCDVDNDISSSK